MSLTLTPVQTLPVSDYDEPPYLFDRCAAPCSSAVHPSNRTRPKSSMRLLLPMRRPRLNSKS